MTNPPNKVEVLEELQLLKRHESPGPDDLLLALFKDGDDLSVQELTKSIYFYYKNTLF